ncbi:MAG: PAS domain S-box protein, partial [bacterium]
MRGQKAELQLVALIVVLAGGIFTLDLLKPAGIAVSVLYAVLVLLAGWVRARSFTWMVAAGASVLTGVGLVVHLSVAEMMGVTIANRALSLLMIWATAILLLWHKGAEDALLQQEAHTRAILDSALDAVVGMDEQGAITNWSPRAEAIFGWTAAEAVGKKVSYLIIPPRYREAHLRGLRRFLATGEGPVLN